MPRKRSAQGAGSIRKRKDGTWEARYTTGRDPGTGKQVRRSIYGKTQKEVLEKLKGVQADMQGGVYVEPSKLTVSMWLDTWLKEYNAHLKQKTLNVYKGYAESTIKPALGAVKLTKLAAPAIQKFYNDLQRKEKPLSPKSIKNIHGALHKALEQAVELGYIRTNPANACKLPRVEKPQIKPLEENDIERFLQAINGHENERVFIVDLFTGLRQAEIIGLTWDCVDFEKGTLFVYRQLQLIEGDYQFTSLKNDKTRLITPAPFVMEALRTQKRIQSQWRLLVGPAWAGGDYVFTNQLGEHLKRQTIYKQYKRIVTEIGLPQARFHDLRHTYAVSALQSGDDVKTVQAHLGHHTAAFTLDTYAHVTEKMRKDSAARMEAFIKGLRK